MPGAQNRFVLLRVLTEEGYAFLRSKIPNLGLTASARGLEVVDARGVRGAVAYDQWAPNSCQAHMAVDTPVAWRTLLPHVFLYPFTHVQVLIGVIREKNEASWKMAESLGFRLAYVLKDGWAPGEALRQYEMRREDCRWLPKSVE